MLLSSDQQLDCVLLVHADKTQARHQPPTTSEAQESNRDQWFESRLQPATSALSIVRFDRNQLLELIIHPPSKSKPRAATTDYKPSHTYTSSGEQRLRWRAGSAGEHCACGCFVKLQGEEAAKGFQWRARLLRNNESPDVGLVGQRLAAELEEDNTMRVGS